MDEQELIKKFNIDIEALKREQLRLVSSLKVKDSRDFSDASRFGAIESIVINNKIISAIIVCDKDCNILEQQYSTDKLRFPYLRNFKSYREIPAMVDAFNKLSEVPDLVFIHGDGISHPALGIASHFSLATGTPAIGVSGDLFEEAVISKDGQDILIDGKKVGCVLKSKEKANPLFVSPGNQISIATACAITKSFIRHPHKLPEPLHLAHKYARSVKDELKLQ